MRQARRAAGRHQVASWDPARERSVTADPLPVGWRSPLAARRCAPSTPTCTPLWPRTRATTWRRPSCPSCRPRWWPWRSWRRATAPGSAPWTWRPSSPAPPSPGPTPLPCARRPGEARHQMSEAEEDLAASLNLSAGTAWAKLHGTVSSQPRRPRPLSRRRPGEVGTGEGTQVLPMSAVRGLAHHRDAAVRQAAYEAELQGWETVAALPGGRHERHQGASADPEPAPGLAGRPGPGPVRQQRRPRHPGGDARGPPGVVPRLPALSPGQGSPPGPGQAPLV